MKNIHSADEQTLLEAILCTKFKGKAMVDFHTRDVRSYKQLKHELEAEYLSKRSTAHLQLEFNSLKQKAGENAHFGRRIDVLAMELFESMEEDQNHTVEQQRAILKKLQALHNFQIGLHEDIKLLIRSQRYRTLQEAIVGASAEEKETRIQKAANTPEEKLKLGAHQTCEILRFNATSAERQDTMDAIAAPAAMPTDLRWANKYTEINTVEKYYIPCKMARQPEETGRYMDAPKKCKNVNKVQIIIRNHRSTLL